MAVLRLANCGPGTICGLLVFPMQPAVLEEIILFGKWSHFGKKLNTVRLRRHWTQLTWWATVPPLCSVPGLCGPTLCLQTPQCLSLWVGRGRPSRRLHVPLVQTGKTPARGGSVVYNETSLIKTSWSLDTSDKRKKCQSFTCSSSSFVTMGMRFRTLRAALCVAKRILIGRLLKSVPSSSALAISASVRVSWKRKEETFKKNTVYHTRNACVHAFLWKQGLSVLSLLLLVLLLTTLIAVLLKQIQSDTWCVDYTVIIYAWNQNYITCSYALPVTTLNPPARAIDLFFIFLFFT